VAKQESSLLSLDLFQWASQGSVGFGSWLKLFAYTRERVMPAKAGIQARFQFRMTERGVNFTTK
jgi:hypothetical protein